MFSWFLRGGPRYQLEIRQGARKRWRWILYGDGKVLAVQGLVHGYSTHREARLAAERVITLIKEGRDSE